MNKNFIDITGKRFGLLTAVEYDKTHKTRSGAYWRCQCDCGNFTTVNGASLRSGHTRSCGCQKGNRKNRPMAYSRKPIVIKAINTKKEERSMKTLFNTNTGCLISEKQVLSEYMNYVNGVLDKEGIDATVCTLSDWINIVYTGTQGKLIQVMNATEFGIKAV